MANGSHICHVLVSFSSKEEAKERRRNRKPRKRAGDEYGSRDRKEVEIGGRKTMRG